MASRSSRNSTSEYFANLSGEALGGEIMARLEDYRKFILATGRLTVWRNLYNAYYKEFRMGAVNNKSGEVGQYTNTSVNQFKSLLDRLRTLITQQRVEWDPRSVNGDVQSMKETILGKSILDYYLKQKNLEDRIDEALLWGMLCTEGFVSSTWDASSGKVYFRNPVTGSEIHEGDLKFNVFDPTRVARDPTKLSWDANDWVTTISFVNRFDEAAKYPELADKIKALSYDWRAEMQYMLGASVEPMSSDDIAVYHFYHRPTPACPNGRYVKLFDSDLVVLETPLPYKEIPIYRLAPADHLGTPFGYSVSLNLLPMQRTYDSLTDTIATNQELFGVQNVIAPKGSNLEYSQLANGAKFIEFDTVPGSGQNAEPKGMSLVSTSPELFSREQRLEALMQTISGVNSVARGAAPENLKSGTALALVQSMAVQANMPLQFRYARMLERLGTGMIRILQAFANVPRLTEIVGKNNKSMMQSWKSDDIQGIDRVIVDLGNPLTNTHAGRLNIAEALVTAKLITTPQEYLTVLETGTLDPMIHGDEAELLLIHQENEDLAEGKAASVIALDKHQLHIQEHKAVLADTDVRRNPAVVQAVLQHIQEHINALKTVDPQLLAAIGEKSLAPAPPAPQPPPPQPAQVLVQAAPQPPQAPPAPQGASAGPSPAPHSGGSVKAPQINPALLSTQSAMLNKAASVQPARLPVSPLDK